MKDLIHKLNLLTKEMQLIDSKTDILFLSIVSNQLTSVMNDNGQKMMGIYNMLQSDQWKDVKADDPKKKELQAQMAAARAQNDILSVTFDSFNLALNKLILALTPIMEAKYPVLNGEVKNVVAASPKKKMKKQMPEDDKNEHAGQSAPQDVPVVRKDDDGA